MGIIGLLYAGDSIGESMFIGVFSGILLTFIFYVLPAIWRAIKKSSEPSAKAGSREKKASTSPAMISANKEKSNGSTSDINQALGISTTERLTSETSQRAGINHAEERYDSLFEELKAKCHPKQFMEPYDHEKVKVANELYSRILKAEHDKEKQNELRQEAIEKLGVSFSSRRLYDKLIALTNPANFMNPYDEEKVAIANDYYQRVLQNAESMVELEVILEEVKENSAFVSNNTIESPSTGRNNLDGIDNTGVFALTFIAISIVLAVISVAIITIIIIISYK